LIAYVDRRRSDCDGNAPRVRVYNRKSRSYFPAISSDEIVVSLVPLLSVSGTDEAELLKSHDNDSDHSKLISQLSVSITSLAFTSSGQYLAVAVCIAPQPRNSGPRTESVKARPLDVPISGIVLWCCGSHSVVGALLCPIHLLGPFPSTSSVFSSSTNHKDVVETSTDDRNGDGYVSTPPRPKAVVVNKPFNGEFMSRSSNQNQQQNQRCVEIDCMQFSHQDSFLTVGLRDETTPLMYAVNWRPTLTTVHRTRAEIHECEDISEKMDLSTDELSTGRRYLQSSSEYFTQLLDAKSSSLCVTVPVFTSTTPSPGRRMAALLLHSAQAWLSTDPASKVFALQSSQGSGKSDHLCCLVSSLQQLYLSTLPSSSRSTVNGSASDINFVTCVLPAPATIVTSFTDLHQGEAGCCESGDPTPASSTPSMNLIASATYAEIAYDFVLSLCRQLVKCFGGQYTAALLKGLTTELTIYRNMHKKSATAVSGPRSCSNDNAPADTNNVKGENLGFARVNRRRAHARQFSEAGVAGSAFDSAKSSSSTPGTSTSASSSLSFGWSTPPFLFPPFAFASTIRREETIPHQQQGNSENSSVHTLEFLLFSELICSTCEGVSLTSLEAKVLQQPTGIVLIPNLDFLPFLSLSRLFQLLISDPLRDLDIHKGNAEPKAVIVLDNLDTYDHLNQHNQVQAVLDMLLHCTPSWIRLIVATNSPFNSTTRNYLSMGGDNDNGGVTGLQVKHFCLRGENGSGGGGTASNLEAGYRLDLQDSISSFLNSLMSSTATEPKTESPPHGENVGNGGVDVAVEQRDNLVDEMLSVVLNEVDDSYHCWQLLQSLLALSFKSTADFLNMPTLLQTLSMFDFNDVMMTVAFAVTAPHEVKLVQKMLEILAATFEPPPVKALEDMLVAYASSNEDVHAKLLSFSMLVNISVPLISTSESNIALLRVKSNSSGKHIYLRQHMSVSHSAARGGGSYGSSSNPFGVDVQRGHSLLTWLYLNHSSNKSIAVDHTWQSYLKTYGPSHLHRACRILHTFTGSIRKIDETCGMKGPLPVQLGYISGLQEIYARRVGIYGPLPATLGCLDQLRVLSMGNNKISGCIPKSLGNLHHLQRIVLHQNRLSGVVPSILSHLGCIVNLAGNPLLIHGDDVPYLEKLALQQLYRDTGGPNWVSNLGWNEGTMPVSQWYKVGVLGSNVHSIVMSSNNMIGQLPSSISNLQMLRMVELATMPGLRGHIPSALCQLVNLRRLCICRCGLTGVIPPDINQLLHLEELQLFGNNLSGSIPNSLGDLTSLRLLSLGEYTGGNNFTPSVLPSCISRLRKLEALFMANCHLRGPLPNWIGNLTELRQLDLQRNAVSGSIPSAFQNLKSLLYLNLKDNTSLSGPLPVFPLGKLTKLNRLSLVHCGFESNADTLAELQRHLPRCRLWI